MRWLSFLVLVGCGGVVPVCSDAPLAPQTCTAIGGTWVLLQAGQQVRCGAQVFEQGLTLESSGGLLTGAMAGRELSGFHYPDGVFEAYGSFETEERFSFRGQHHAVRGEPEELRAAVKFSQTSEGCDTEWQFVARRP